MLALLPLERVEVTPGEPCVHGGPQFRVTSQPGRERDVRELEGEPCEQSPQRAQLIQLEQAVEPVARVAPGGTTRPVRSM